MARTPTNFTHNNQLSSSAESLVSSVSSNTDAIIRKLSFYNSGSSNRTVTVYVVETSGTAGAANTLAVKTITPGKTWNCIEIQGEILATGMSLQAAQDAGTDVNVNCSGALIT